MNRDTLITCLHAAAESARRDLSKAANDGRARWAHISPETVQPFGDALLSNTSIAALNGLWYSLPYQGGRLDLRTAAIYLVDRALDHNAGEVIDDLLRIVSSRTIELISVRAVEGIAVSSPLKLGDGLSIVAPSALPNTAETRTVFSRHNAPKHGWGCPPSAAILLRENFHVPFCEPPPGESGPTFYRAEVELNMEYALWAATLASDGAPEFRQGYDVVASCGWPGMTSGSMRESQSFPSFIPHACSVDADLARNLFLQLKKKPGKLDLAINKLRASRRRTSSAERAVDLGTCIEVLLMHDNKINTEIRYKIASRAAWLVGIDGPERLAIFKRARDLYDLRSTSVHTGEEPKDLKNCPEGIGAALDSYDKLCASIIIKIALQDGWPDWTKLVLNVEESLNPTGTVTQQ